MDRLSLCSSYIKCTICAGLRPDTNEPICFKLGMMLGTSELRYDSSLNDPDPMSRSQDYRKARVCAVICCTVAWSNANVCDVWLCKRDDFIKIQWVWRIWIVCAFALLFSLYFFCFLLLSFSFFRFFFFFFFLSFLLIFCCRFVSLLFHRLGEFWLQMTKTNPHLVGSLLKLWQRKYNKSVFVSRSSTEKHFQDSVSRVRALLYLRHPTHCISDTYLISNKESV